jgi:acyl dehydratase
MTELILESPAALKDFVGREIAVTDWLTVTQERINLFAEATEDRQWIHVDGERAARESPFKGTIAHGFLTLSATGHQNSEWPAHGGELRIEPGAFHCTGARRDEDSCTNSAAIDERHCKGRDGSDFYSDGGM